MAQTAIDEGKEGGERKEARQEEGVRRGKSQGLSRGGSSSRNIACTLVISAAAAHLHGHNS